MKVLKTSNWQTYKIAPDGTHHILGESPAYQKRFAQVLKFHSPGIAPVSDETGSYHIDPLGQPLYTRRYSRTFGFYNGRAAIDDNGQWFHILTNGCPFYKNRYQWCGNFQENLCSVKDLSGAFYHIDEEGARIYPQSYSYVGDFHDGSAVVQTDEGLHFHIDPVGNRLYRYEYMDLDVFHKGFARAKDSQGWFHIDRSGQPVYDEKYAQIEPFYNGVARVETKFGELLLIDEQGKTIQTIREKVEDPFHKVSGELVSYWKLFTLKTAQDLNLFEQLPNTLPIIAQRTSLLEAMAEKILLGLKEMQYVVESRGRWELTTAGEFLTASHPFSLRDAQNLWMMEHFSSWEQLSFSLQTSQSAFEKCYETPWFNYLDKNPKKREHYHQALSQYALRDYEDLGSKIDFSNHHRVGDIGGSTGTLLEILNEKYPHLEGHLLDLPSVIAQIPNSQKKKLDLHPLNFFETWPELELDGAILSRIIHDWPDEKAIHILKQARHLLKNASSRLYVIENILDKATGSGALLNLNMLVMTGGKERTLSEFHSLFDEGGFVLEHSTPLNCVSSIFVLKPLKDA